MTEFNGEKLNFFAKWARFFITKYKITVIFLIALIFLGVYATGQNQRQDIPPITINFAFITAIYPGAGPETIASEVINPIENAIKGHDDVDRIRSTASKNFGFLSVELGIFDESKIEKAITDFKESIDQLALPANVETRVFTETTSGPSLAYALYSDTLSFDEVLAATPKLKEYFEQSSNEIKEVMVAPDTSFDVRVELDAVKLGKKRLDIQTVKTAIQANLSVLPGGSIKDEISGTNHQININNPSSSLEDVQNIIVGPNVKLIDVANVIREPAGQDELTMSGYLINGQPEFNNQVVYLMMMKTDDGDVIRMKQDVDKAIEEVYTKGILDENISLGLAMDSAKYVSSQVDSLLRNGLIGLIAIIIVFMFFIDLRIGLVVGLIIPFAFLITLFILKQIGYTINILTMFAMLLTLGILVDNAIVIAEGIVHRIHKYGEKKLKAAILAIRDLGPAVTAATLTTIVVFIPAANMGGFMGEIMKFIPYTIIIMMTVSYFLAISITPLLSVWILKEETEEERRNRKLKPWQKYTVIPAIVHYGQRFIDAVVDKYEKVMKVIIRKTSLKIIIVVVVALALVGSIIIVGSGKIPGSQFPITDTWQIMVSVDYPAGTSTQVKKKIMSDIVQEGIKVPYFEGSYIFGGTNNILITEPAERADDKDTTVYTIIDDLDASIDHIRDEAPDGIYISVGAASYGPPAAGVDVILEIRNSDSEVLAAAVNDIDKFVRGEGILGNYDIQRISNDMKDKLVPSVDVSFDQEMVEKYGLTPMTTSLVINSVFSESEISKISIREDGVQDDIILTFNEESTNSIEKLKKLLVPTAAGRTVTLDQVAEVKEVQETEEIGFIDGVRTVVYSIDLDIPENDRSGAAANLETDIKNYLNEEKLAALGLEIDGVGYGGFASEIQADMSNLQVVFMIAIIAVYLILVFQFNSYIQPGLILMAIPMSFIGVFPALWVVGSSLDMISGLGIIALVGIVVNDAIIFVDYFNRQRQKHPDWSMSEALVYTGKVRFKPIFGTSVTTIAGILPLTLVDPFWTGLGSAIIGGLIFSTLGNLVVLPILLCTADSLKKLPRKFLRRKEQPVVESV